MRENSIFKERILQCAEKMGVTKYEIYQNTGISNGVFSQKGGLSEDNVLKFISYYKEVSPDWLLTGKGEMFKKEVPPAPLEIKKLDDSTEHNKDAQLIPLYDISASAGFVELLDSGNQNILDMIKIPNLTKVDGAMAITGDSMYPLLKSGDVIIFKQIHNLDYLHFGSIYVLSYNLEGDEYLVIKYVNKAEKNGFVKLVSYNKEYYSPMEIPVSTIRAIALVKASIRYNTMM